MLKSLIKQRPRQVLAVYIEAEQVQIVRARRRWRRWEMEPAEVLPLPDNEGLFDYLQRLALRPSGKQKTALLLLLPRTQYSFHREHYPAALGDRLEEALTFDWQENIFHEQEQTLHFFGPPVPVEQHFSVPVYSLQRDVYERFQQALGVSSFETFAVIPAAMVYDIFLPSFPEEEDRTEILGRLLDSSHMEIQRFYRGLLLDSMVLGRAHDTLRLFRENLLCLGNGESESPVPIHLMCGEGESVEPYAPLWEEQELRLDPLVMPGSLVSHWLKSLLEREDIQAFDTHLVLKPWKAPRILWPLLAMLILYSLFAGYQFHSAGKQKEVLRALKKQNSQLETQWKPIEQLQTRIAKFMEDQKTLSEFSVEGYPLLEILTILSQATPPDTWLNYLSVRKGQLILRGESKSAIKYLPELSKIDGFSDVKFASPVTRNPTSDQERFNVQIQLDLAKMKKTIENMPPEKSEDKPDADSDAPLPAVGKPVGPAAAPKTALPGTSQDDPNLSPDAVGEEYPAEEMVEIPPEEEAPGGE